MALEDPDLALVRALQAGEDRALETLMHRHQEGVFRFVFRHISNEADAIAVDESEGQRQPSSNRRKPDQQAQDREKLRAVEKAIVELPQELKSPLILTALEDRSYAETAELLGTSPKAVEMKVYRARKLLLGKMNELGF